MNRPARERGGERVWGGGEGGGREGGVGGREEGEGEGEKMPFWRTHVQTSEVAV